MIKKFEEYGVVDSPGQNLHTFYNKLKSMFMSPNISDKIKGTLLSEYEKNILVLKVDINIVTIFIMTSEIFEDGINIKIETPELLGIKFIEIRYKRTCDFINYIEYEVSSHAEDKSKNTNTYTITSKNLEKVTDHI
jgi:hypothetical protein